MASAETIAARSRLALEILAAAGPGATIRKSDLWAQVLQRYPLDDREAELHANKSSRGITDWAWATANFVKAGWLVKGGSDGWSITADGLEALQQEPDAARLIAESKDRYAAWSRARDSERSAALAGGIVPLGGDQEEVLRAASLFVERGLNDGGSVFAPGREVWTTTVADELVRLFVDSDGVEGDGFIGKVQLQLRDASDDARLLMAELVTLQLLPAAISTIGEKAKRERVELMLGLMDHPVRIPAEVDRAFGAGSFNPGTRMASALGAAMTILINFVSTWAGLDSDHREELLGDPWAMRDLIRSIDGEPFPSQRHALLYLTHPETFLSIVSTSHKTAIRDAFIGEIGGDASGDIDRDLLAITIALQLKSGGPVSYYEGPLAAAWRPAPKPDPVPAPDLGPDSAPTPDPEPDPAPSSPSAFPPVTPELADSLFMDAEWPQTVLDLLERRRQIILHGPPGTGKTYLARALAAHVAARAETVLVQFHPSYSYEDFVEGYRPVSSNGSLSYELKEGPFRRIAREAQKNPDRNYVLVIDEINRGNLPKIFGELYFLLEYRDERIAMLYGSDDGFTLPKNVFIIGTMNTTDRSIALLDSAMRRRFSFVEMHPDVEPTASVLPRWLAARGLDREPALLLTALNERIGDRAARIGPSYLMPSDGDLSDGRLREIWRHEIIPLLEEFHYGEDRDLDREYGLDALRSRPNSGLPG